MYIAYLKATTWIGKVFFASLCYAHSTNTDTSLLQVGRLIDIDTDIAINGTTDTDSIYFAQSFQTPQIYISRLSLVLDYIYKSMSQS